MKKFWLSILVVLAIALSWVSSTFDVPVIAIISGVSEFFSHIGAMVGSLGNSGLFSFALITSIGSYTSIIKGNSVRLIAPVYYLDHYCYECGRLHKTRQIVEADYLHYCSFSSKYDVEGDNVVTTIDTMCDDCHDRVMQEIYDSYAEPSIYELLQLRSGTRSRTDDFTTFYYNHHELQLVIMYYEPMEMWTGAINYKGQSLYKPFCIFSDSDDVEDALTDGFSTIVEALTSAEEELGAIRQFMAC